MLKKLIVFVLVFSIVLGGASVSFAAVTNDVQKENENAILNLEKAELERSNSIMQQAGANYEADKKNVKPFNNWYSRYAHVWGRTVSGTTTTQDAQAAARAKQQVGDGYNYNLYNIDQDSSYYCSKLVW